MRVDWRPGTVTESQQVAIRRLFDALGYVIADATLAERALSHRSARGRSNERLEFLGDAVLDTVISDALFRRFPDADEGILSRLRASLVRDRSLAVLATGLELGALIRLGSGELKSGGARRDSILADALEALFGAVFLDGGYAAAESVILRVFAQRLQTLELDAARKDAKTELQEVLQSRALALPVYELLATTGEQHRQRFSVACRIDEPPHETHGEGGSRRTAEQRAARAMLKFLSAEQPDE